MDLNNFLQYAVLILAVMVIFSIPILIQLARLIGAVIVFIKDLNKSSNVLLSEATTSVRNVNSIIGTFNEMVVGLKDLVSSTKELGEGFKRLGKALKDSETYFASIFKLIAKFATSLKVTLLHFTKGDKNKGGTNNEPGQ